MPSSTRLHACLFALLTASCASLADGASGQGPPSSSAPRLEKAYGVPRVVDRSPAPGPVVLPATTGAPLAGASTPDANLALGSPAVMAPASAASAMAAAYSTTSEHDARIGSVHPAFLLAPAPLAAPGASPRAGTLSDAARSGFARGLAGVQATDGSALTPVAQLPASLFFTVPPPENGLEGGLPSALPTPESFTAPLPECLWNPPVRTNLITTCGPPMPF